MTTVGSDLSDGIAVIGLAGRFPGAPSLEQFWDNLRNGVESITALDDDDLRARGVPQSVLDHPRFVKASTIIQDVDLFDAAFFGFNPREAEVIDPQQRLFLESCWEVIEQAGYDPETYAGAIGVYAGIGFNAYAYNLARSAEAAGVGGYQLMIGNDKDFLTTRVSYKLNLKGPSVVVQTACSTSLVAVYQACESLQSYRCDMALAGGVSIHIHDTRGYFHQDGMILSPDGHCRAFDAKARGTVSGKGLGVVLLKRLADAINDGDTIRAVIKGWAVNNDGSLKVGYTAPSVDGQAQVIAEALAMSNVPADTISYVEAHGTGTELGDPIEMGALNLVYRAATERRRFCAIGSLKTNIGHLDTAAGVASLIKVVLALEHAELPPSLHFAEPNPQIDFEDTPFFVNTALRAWAPGEVPRRAGVSSFGIGGTNAHVVVEEPPPASETSPAGPVQLLVLSARTPAALDNAAGRLRTHLERDNGVSLADVAHTLRVGRRGFDQRRIIVCRDREEAIQALARADGKGHASGVRSRYRGACAFMFSGQGSQHLRMASEVYRHQEVFRTVVDECAERLQPLLGLDLRGVLYPTTEDGDRCADVLTETRIAQPALFTVEYALAKLWMHWGVVPAAMIGHSIGEYVAACVADVVTLPEALALVAMRGRLMQQQAPGAMLAVQLSVEEMMPRLDGELSLAAENAPRLSVVSGPVAAIDRLAAELTTDGKFARRLQTSHAFHSRMMEGMLPAFRAELGRVALRPPTRPYVSNLTGTWITAEQATDPDYWVAHLRQPVRFSAGIRTLLEGELDALLEVGPGTTLRSLAAQQLDPGGPQVALASLPSVQDTRSDLAALFEAAGRLWTAGAPLDWIAFGAGERRRRVPLPTYPFERQRYWVEPQAQAAVAPAAAAVLQKREDIASWFYLPGWRRTLVPGNDSVLQSDADDCVLLFDDFNGVGVHLSRQFRALGHEVFRLAPAHGFAPVAPGVFSLNMSEPADYGKVLSELKALGMHPRRIVHLLGLSATPGRGVAQVAEGQARGFQSLLYLAQAIGRQRLARPVEISVVAADLHAVLPDDEVAPEKCTVLGPTTVIPQEYATVWCRTIDVGRRPADERPESLARLLMREIGSEARESTVAYRGETRWIQTFDEAPLPPARRPAFRTGGVYVITGGFGSLGLTLADHLSRAYQAKLVLVGRDVPPKRNGWDALLGAGSGARVAQQIRAVRHLEAQGGEVLPARADVADVEQARRALEAAEARFGKIDGVIHAAGLVQGEAFRGIQELTPEHWATQFAAKVYGLVALDEAIGDRPLEVRLLTSSISCELGGLGYAAYAAANHFLDGYTARRGAAARPWTALNLDGFRFGPADGSRTALSDLLMSGAEGVEVIERVLAQEPHPSRLVVSTGSLPARLAQYVTKAAPVSQADEQSAAPAPAGHARPALSSPYEAPADAVEETVAQMWQELLGIEQVGRLDDFFELGGHSLLAVQVVSRIEQAFSVQVSLRNIFEARSVEALADRVKTLVWMTQGEQETVSGDEREEREEIEI